MAENITPEEMDKRMKESVSEISGFRENESLSKNPGAYFSALLENLDQGVLISDEMGLPLVFNSACFRIMKKIFGAELRAGERPHASLPERKAVAYWEDIHQKVLGGEKINTVYQHVFTEGDVRSYEFTFTPIFEMGRVKGFTELIRDVTEQRKTERALRESEKRYRALFENAGDALLMIEAKGPQAGKIINANHAAAEMHGYSLEALANLNVKQLMVQEVAWEVPTQIKRILSGEWVKMELIHRRKDGTVFPVEASAGLLELGERQYVLVFVRDISGRRQAESALKESEAKYRILFNHIADAVLVIDRDTKKLLDCNRTAVQRYGYSREELLNMTLYDLHPPEEAHLISVNALHQDTEPHCRTHLLKNGKRMMVEVHTGEIVLDDKKAQISIVRDITARREAEEALRKSEERFRKLAENSPFGLSIMDEDGIFEYFNPKFTEILGYDPKDIPDKDAWFEKAYPDRGYRNSVISVWKKDLATVKSGQTSERAFNVRCKDGREKTIHFRHVEISDGKQYTTYEDITARKRLETQLRQAQKMEAIGTLAGGIAHDFNNILSAVIGYAELAIQDAPVNTTLERDLRNVLEAGERAKALVNQILTFSRQKEHELRPIQILPVIKEALKLLRASLPTTIEIRRDLRGDSLIMGDPTQIHQVLMNLCTNAAHAMNKKGGLLEVGLKEEDLDLDFSIRHHDVKPGRYLKLSVSDTGCGMPPAVQERIFDPFFTTKGEGEGTGMGLSVVHGIVKGHGGTITVYSEPEQGSIFNVYFPVVEARDLTDAEVPTDLRKGHERILFIDDEEFQVDLGKQILERLGYKVITRRSSVEALELFCVNPYGFDLVITDLTMPNLTGDALARELIAVRPDIPIILCTGFSDRITEEQALSLGIRAFIMKPIVMREMSETVRRVLDEK